MRTGLADFFNSELWRVKHDPLVLGWSDDQLAPVVDLLDPHLPTSLPDRPHKVVTPEMKRAAAACALSVSLAFLLTGRSVRYSRDRNHYGGPKRYGGGGRLYSYHYVTGAMDVLHQAGLVNLERGDWVGTGGRGRQSIAGPAEELLTLLEPVIDTGARRAELHEAEVIVLRDLADKRNIEYDDTEETNALRAEVKILNDALGRQELFLNGRRFPIPLLRRIFNGFFHRGGRFYCLGDSYQNIPSEDRRNLQLLIDGVLYRMVEVDYANLHAVMAYAEAGLPVPHGDLYVIDGFSRPVVKRAFNVLLNVTASHQAVAALGEDLAFKDRELWRHTGLPTRHRGECHRFAEKVVAAVEEEHRAIAEFFGSDRGAAFMRRDSDMAAAVMSRVLAETGRCPLVVHDSFLVPSIDLGVLVRVMREVAAGEGLPLCLEDSEGRSWPAASTAAPLLHLAETTPELHRQEHPKNAENVPIRMETRPSKG